MDALGVFLQTNAVNLLLLVSLKLTVGLPLLEPIMIAFLPNSLILVYYWPYQLMVDQAVDFANSLAYSIGESCLANSDICLGFSPYSDTGSGIGNDKLQV